MQVNKVDQEHAYRLAYMGAYARKLLNGSQAEFNALALVPMADSAKVGHSFTDRNILHK